MEELGYAIGITPSSFPYLEFYGDARFSYSTNASRFESRAKNQGKAIANLNGRIKVVDYDNDIFLLECDIETTQPIELLILGAKSIESDSEFDEEGLIVLPAGDHSIKANIIFEYVFEWEVPGS